MRDDMVEVNGQRLHVTDTEGHGPVLLFAHGNLMDTSMWTAVTDLLAPRFRCLAWDMRLHGRSVDDGLPYTYWDAARDALRRCERPEIFAAQPAAAHCAPSPESPRKLTFAASTQGLDGAATSATCAACPNIAK